MELINNLQNLLPESVKSILSDFVTDWQNIRPFLVTALQTSKDAAKRGKIQDVITRGDKAYNVLKVFFPAQ